MNQGQELLYHLDASTFQIPLAELANTIAYKVQRESRKKLPQPDFVNADLFVLLRQALHCYNFFFFLNADERRQSDSGWRIPYSIVTLPLIRCMIDSLYNVTAILADPGKKAYQFRESGYKWALQALDADQARYAGDPQWDAYIAKQRSLYDFLIRRDGFRPAEIANAVNWPTLSGYLRVKKNVPLTPHQQVLKKLTFGFWQEYSALSHATYDGLLPTAMFYIQKDVSHDERDTIETVFERVIAMHLSRMAAVLLCIVTELQAFFLFDGANINQRLHAVWDALIVVPEIKELYDERYDKLMKDRNICRD